MARDAETIAERREEFLADATRELERVERAKAKARRMGKRSRAAVNIKRLARKYGVSAAGYGFLDVTLGRMVLAAFGADDRRAAIMAVLAAELKGAEERGTQ